MPTSNLTLWPPILHMAWEAKPKSVVDVGPGYGKGGLLLREYLEPIDQLDAVEAEPRYLEDFPWLSAIYDEVHLVDATQFDYDGYDLVLMVEVLEHLTKDDGLELLARIPGRVIVCTPRDYFQNPEHEEYPTESHRSVWSAEEIASVRSLEVHDIDAQQIGGVLVRTGPLAVAGSKSATTDPGGG